MIDSVSLRSTALEATFLLGEAIRELLLPQHISSLAEKWVTQRIITEQYAGAIGHMAIMSAVIGVCRVHETRDHFLVPWLFSVDDLKRLGMPVIEDLVGSWKHFVMLRNQWAGHATANKTVSKSRPGHLLPLKQFGVALKKTRLHEPEAGMPACDAGTSGKHADA